MDYVSYGAFALVTAILSAKWAMELGFTQFRQMLWALVGLALGPVALLILYVRLVGQQKGSAKDWV